MTIERLFYLTLIAGLQLNVLREGYIYAKHVQKVINLPGLRHEGTFFGSNDLSDYQYRSFRDAAPLLAAAMGAFLVLSRLACAFPSKRQVFMVTLSLLFLYVLHGAYSVYVITLAVSSYTLAQQLAGRPYGLRVVWSYACATLLLARLLDGLPFSWISPALAPLDEHGGLLRWHIHYNLMVLRLISFAADLHWARKGKQPNAAAIDSAAPRSGDKGCAPSDSKEKDEEGDCSSGGIMADWQPKPQVGAISATAGSGRHGNHECGGAGALQVQSGVDFELRMLSETPLPLPYYSLMPFLEYVLYQPLYIAGPIITFNSFAAQRMLRKKPLLKPRQVLIYALRGALAWGCLEGLTHALPYNSIAKHRILDRLVALAPSSSSAAHSSSGTGEWPSPRPLHYAITGYWVLVFMWLKFTVIWRFFRLVALMDGVVPPENMTRCVCNNYDIEGFWRGWHASYNRWLVRYMYVPLGGSRWRAVNVWVIFTFVALWHDLEWRLLGWAWLMAAAIAPEMVVKALGRSALMRHWHGTTAFRHASALAGAANILMLMTANLVGFVVGLDGIGPLAQQVLGRPQFLAVVFLTLFAAVQLMLWKRENEARPAAAVTSASARGGGVSVSVSGGDSGCGGGSKTV